MADTVSSSVAKEKDDEMNSGGQDDAKVVEARNDEKCKEVAIPDEQHSSQEIDCTEQVTSQAATEDDVKIEGASRAEKYTGDSSVSNAGAADDQTAENEEVTH